MSADFRFFPMTVVRAADGPIVAQVPDLGISIQCSTESDVVRLLCEEGDRELQRRTDRGEPLPEPSRLEDVPSALGNVALRVPRSHSTPTPIRKPTSKQRRQRLA
jgi:hypothetical protein